MYRTNKMGLSFHDMSVIIEDVGADTMLDFPPLPPSSSTPAPSIQFKKKKNRKRPSTPIITPINSRFEKVKDVLCAVNNQHVEFSNNLSDINNKLNSRMNELENAISNIRKSMSGLSNDFSGNFGKLSENVQKLDNLCCNQTSTFELLLAEAIEKITSISKTVTNDIVKCKNVFSSKNQN